MLIWHIDEPEGDIASGINNDRDNRAISIEEADGALDIGFESYALFSNNNPTNGTKWDFWFMNNDAYYYTNDNAEICLNSQNYEVLEQYSSQYQCEQNGGNWVKPTIFDKYSNPSSDLNDKALSFFSFELLDSISQYKKRVKVKYESSINYIDRTFLSDYSLIGTSSSSIFYNIGGDVYSLNLLDNSFELREDLSNADIVLTDSNNQSYSSDSNCYFDNENQEICYDSLCEPRFGYFYENDVLDTFNLCSSDETYSSLSISGNNVSIGDIDFDGLDEIVWVSDGKIIAANYNGTIVNGFPIQDNYHGVVLILENEDDEIVLVSKNSSHIDILSLNGNILYSLPFISDQDILAIANKLTDGVRFYDFPVGEGSYWLQRYSNDSHYPYPSGNHIVPDYQDSNQKITNFYNYPNPINDGETTFRFMVHEVIDISINIYNLSGHKVDNITLNNPTNYDYNELGWDIGSLLPGLYFAEIMADGKKEKIIKVVIGY